MGIGTNSVLIEDNMSAVADYAIVFPGQGSQSLGMLSDIAARYPVVNKTFDLASKELDYDLWELVQAGPSEKLDQTMYTQPALLTTSYAVWQILQAKGLTQAKMLAGHSLGEYTALVCAESLSFPQAVKLVTARGLYMQQAVPNNLGAMAAIIGLSNDDVKEICAKASEADEVVQAANFNTIGQVVVAGHKSAVLRVIELAKQQGAKLSVLLPVSVPSHCELMKPAADKLAEMLQQIEFKTPQLTVISNVTATPYTNSAMIRDSLIKQLYMPVLWVDTIQYFIAHGVKTIIECGPGKVLSGLNKRIDKKLQLFLSYDIASLEAIQ